MTAKSEEQWRAESRPAADIASARAICEAASQGPWTALLLDDPPTVRVSTAATTHRAQRADAKFLLAARTGWPAALDALDEAEHEIDVLRMALKWCGGSADFAPGGKARKGWELCVLPLLTDEVSK
jgi:hypothetical protein